MKLRYIHLSLGALVVSTFLPFSAEAQTHSAFPAAPLAPKSELRIYGADSNSTGGGFDFKNGSAATICAASSTGRYRIRVVSEGGGRLRGAGNRAALTYNVLFRDGTGAEQTKRMTGFEVSFEGKSPGQPDCSRGANALVYVSSPDSELRGNVAGEYFDRLTLMIDPL